MHRLTDRHGVWATLARGYRAGGFNIGTSVPDDRRRFADEYLWSVEAGWKGANGAGDRRADFNMYYLRASNRKCRRRCNSTRRTRSPSSS